MNPFQMEGSTFYSPCYLCSGNLSVRVFICAATFLRNPPKKLAVIEAGSDHLHALLKVYQKSHLTTGGAKSLEIVPLLGSLI